MDMAEIGGAADALLDALKARDGREWKAARGELPMPYEELALWVLVHEGSDLDAVHAALRGIVAPFLPRLSPVHVAVAYALILDGIETQLDFLGTNAELLEPGRALGDMPTVVGPADGIFAGMDSRR